MHTAGANTCQLCAKDGLTVAAPPMYCSSCGVIIKHRLTYYWIVDEMAAQYCFCTLCFNRSRGGNISFKGLTFSKAKLQKGKNIAEFEEAVRLISYVPFFLLIFILFLFFLLLFPFAVGTM